MTLFKAKQNGHKRISPQETAESFSKSRTMFKCEKCNSELESEGLLNAHIRSHVDEEFTCDQCDLVFREKTVLEEHKKSDHKKNKIAEEWNCNDCSFQGHGAVELINHLKVTGHQPSKDINKKKSFNDYRQCYTCRKEFDGYYNLMDHRKVVHPSNKPCRNFPVDCKWGNDCWYVHHQME